VHEAVLVLAVFSASLVEMVEALTIVLAVGITRGWKTALSATVAALAVLGLITLAFGPLLSRLPLSALRVLIGSLLLVFGLGWLRKAILRASGWKALHDEERIFKEELAALGGSGDRSTIDGSGFVVAFKGVLLEGLEVAFIIVTFGATQHRIGLAVLGATAALLAVVIAGLVVHRPLTRVPENSLKMVVGVLLSSFGTFWAGEGLGAQWPGGSAALLGVIAFVSLCSAAMVVALRARAPARL
jgi:uncharacterized membrane protein